MITTQTHNPADRLHSFELVAAAAREQAAGGSAARSS
jgi:hypothetical protein